ncbi:flagellar hook-basal body protein [Arcobacter sp. KX21116]|jgi:flagellar basal-body rod protein FlgG|uniref:flagellar hook-basal body protein n=1 Tax=Arcobacter iocasae TaxID=2906515 RepID=UPI0035D3F970|tara:strand:+ start:1417 stop:2142 length:726 start_codon:yes stop_codon:yes gene_type:complete
MNQGMYPLAAAMVNQINRVDTVSNNLANSRTIGFKQENLAEGTFNNYLLKANLEGKKSEYINELTNKVPKIDQKFIDSSQGPIVQTGNDLDFALKEPQTFFAVLDQNGNVEYTKDGSFKNLDGFLVDSKGNNVLSADGEPIAIEEGYKQAIGVFNIDYNNLEKFGDNNYKLKDEQQAAVQVQAMEDNENFVLQGSLEQSNVNSVMAMVQLIEAQRSYEQSQKGITGIDSMNKTIIQKLGNG